MIIGAALRRYRRPGGSGARLRGGLPEGAGGGRVSGPEGQRAVAAVAAPGLGDGDCRGCPAGGVGLGWGLGRGLERGWRARETGMQVLLPRGDRVLAEIEEVMAAGGGSGTFLVRLCGLAVLSVDQAPFPWKRGRGGNPSLVLPAH